MVQDGFETISRMMMFFDCFPALFSKENGEKNK